MTEERSGCIGLAVLAIIIYFAYSHYQSKLEDKYNDGVEAGYSQGQYNPLYPEDVAREQIKENPEEYCGGYAQERLREHLEYLDSIYVCREK